MCAAFACPREAILLPWATRPIAAETVNTWATGFAAAKGGETVTSPTGIPHPVRSRKLLVTFCLPSWPSDPLPSVPAEDCSALEQSPRQPLAFLEQCVLPRFSSAKAPGRRHERIRREHTGRDCSLSALASQGLACCKPRTRPSQPASRPEQHAEQERQFAAATRERSSRPAGGTAWLWCPLCCSRLKTGPVCSVRRAPAGTVLRQNGRASNARGGEEGGSGRPRAKREPRLVKASHSACAVLWPSAVSTRSQQLGCLQVGNGCLEKSRNRRGKKPAAQGSRSRSGLTP